MAHELEQMVRNEGADDRNMTVADLQYMLWATLSIEPIGKDYLFSHFFKRVCQRIPPRDSFTIIYVRRLFKICHLKGPIIKEDQYRQILHLLQASTNKNIQPIKS